MKIIFVCTANVCRSPLAEGYLKFLLKKQNLKGLDVSSAGVAALFGAPAFECAIEVAKQFDFDISGHRAQQLTTTMAREANAIFCMETWQGRMIIDMDSKLSQKVSLLGKFHPQKQTFFQIPDPREFNVSETLETFNLIQPSIERYLESVIRSIQPVEYPPSVPTS